MIVPRLIKYAHGQCTAFTAFAFAPFQPTIVRASLLTNLRARAGPDGGVCESGPSAHANPSFSCKPPLTRSPSPDPCSHPQRRQGHGKLDMDMDMGMDMGRDMDSGIPVPPRALHNPRSPPWQQTPSTIHRTHSGFCSKVPLAAVDLQAGSLSLSSPVDSSDCVFSLPLPSKSRYFIYKPRACPESPPFRGERPRRTQQKNKKKPRVHRSSSCIYGGYFVPCYLVAGLVARWRLASFTASPPGEADPVSSPCLHHLLSIGPWSQNGPRELSQRQLVGAPTSDKTLLGLPQAMQFVGPSGMGAHRYCAVHSMLHDAKVRWSNVLVVMYHYHYHY